jgi:putative cell wall-binding protein
MRTILTVMLAMLLVQQPAAVMAQEVPSPELLRLSGPDRYATAAAISGAAFPDGNDVALLARADLFADALAAGAFAGVLEAPVLLSSRGAVPGATMAELTRLGVSRVVLLGGIGALGEDVERQLLGRGLAVERVAGSTRFATAAALARRVGPASIGSVGGLRTAFLASGENFPDALAVGPVAYAARLPVLLTPRTTLSHDASAAIRELGIEQVILLGGEAAVTGAVERQLQGVATRRLSGATRTATAAAIAAFAVQSAGFADTEVLLVRGDAFPDALASAAYAGGRTAPLLLIASPNQLGDAVQDYLAAAGEGVRTITALGGTAAVSADALSDAGRAVRGVPTVDLRLLFSRRASGFPAIADIHLRGADGTVRRVTDARTTIPDVEGYGGAGYLEPTWSPDGQQLAATVQEGSSTSVAVLRLDGSVVRRLAQDGSSPGWAPDGSAIAFSSRTLPIQVINPDGSGARVVANTPQGDGSSPSWSPDSRQLAFVTEAGIGVVGRDGTGRRTIALPTGTAGMSVRWSPDGTLLAVVARDAGAPFLGVGDRIVLVAATGSAPVRTVIGADRGLELRGGLSWRADGAVLAFDAHGAQDFLADGRIHEVRLDGTGLRQLTTGNDPVYRR